MDGDITQCKISFLHCVMSQRTYTIFFESNLVLGLVIGLLCRFGRRHWSFKVHSEGGDSWIFFGLYIYRHAPLNCILRWKWYLNFGLKLCFSQVRVIKWSCIVNFDVASKGNIEAGQLGSYFSQLMETSSWSRDFACTHLDVNISAYWELSFHQGDFR